MKLRWPFERKQPETCAKRDYRVVLKGASHDWGDHTVRACTAEHAAQPLLRRAESFVRHAEVTVLSTGEEVEVPRRK